MTPDDLARSALAVTSHPVIQHLSHLLRHWTLDEKAILNILLGSAIGFVVGHYRISRASHTKVISTSFQNSSEALLSHIAMENFGPPDYHLMNHLTLQMSDGTTQVDHILVSRFGVFVIETKDFKGWILANESQKKWTQVLFHRWKGKSRYHFQNPVFQNFRHVCAVRDLLDFLPPDAVKSVVVFTGKAEFKTEVPDGVFSSINGLIDYLRQQTVEVMSINRVQFCVGRLETARLAITAQTDVEHVQNLQRRHGREAKPFA